jgi:hypothetical protein
MPKALFVVRATVADASKRAAFDAWYSREHLPDAVKSFGAEKAWRYWKHQPADRRLQPRLAGSDPHARGAGAGGGAWEIISVIAANAGNHDHRQKLSCGLVVIFCFRRCRRGEQAAAFGGIDGES